jgi:3-hydroxybutyrate dehydrogenase
VGYVAAKHGAVGLVKSLALEGAADGIRATAICPGFVRTPLVEAQAVTIAADRDLTQAEAMNDVLLEPQAIKEMIEPEDVANVAAFLIGAGGRAFTGAPVVMDNGWIAR